MNRWHWMNLTSVMVIVGSLLVWYWFLPDFFSSKTQAQLGETIKVEGAQSVSNDEISIAKKEGNEIKINSSIISDRLFPDNTEAPIRKKDIGDTYVRARSAIAIDADTGTVLHYQSGNERTAIASLTKVMSAIIAIELIDDLDNEIVTIDKDAFYVDGTKVGCPRSGYCVSNRLRIGEKVSARNLLEAMVMNSANDAAVALANHIAGSQGEFAKLMNDKAKFLGLEDTHFCNPSGLDEDDNPGGCYSTAHDLARITAYSLQYDDDMWKAMRTHEKEFHSEDGLITHKLINTDLLLNTMPNCLGGKTGFTYEAGKSLMTVAHHPTDRNKKVVSVMIDNYYRWIDMPDLFGWIFAVYKWPELK